MQRRCIRDCAYVSTGTGCVNCWIATIPSGIWTCPSPFQSRHYVVTMSMYPLCFQRCRQRAMGEAHTLQVVPFAVLGLPFNTAFKSLSLAWQVVASCPMVISVHSQQSSCTSFRRRFVTLPCCIPVFFSSRMALGSAPDYHSSLQCVYCLSLPRYLHGVVRLARTCSRWWFVTG